MSQSQESYSPITPPKIDIKRAALESLKALLVLSSFAAILFAGSLWTDAEGLPWWRAGLPYAVAFISILLAHSGGHWLASSRANAQYRLPWLLPSWGTGISGYIDSLPGSVSSAKSCVLIALSGPVCGVIVSMFWIFVGLRSSSLVPITHSGENLVLGEPLLFKFASHIVFGALSSEFDVLISSVAVAGWLGLVVTACHLLPIEPFDGAFLLRALFPGQAARLRLVALLLLFGVGVFVGGPWAFLSIVLGVGLIVERYFPTLYAILFWRTPSSDQVPVDSDIALKDVILVTALAATLFTVSFTPVLIRIQ